MRRKSIEEKQIEACINDLQLYLKNNYKDLAIRIALIYILLGSIGLPIFSGFLGEMPKILGPTGGCIIGFIVMAFIIGWDSRMCSKVILWLGLI